MSQTDKTSPSAGSKPRCDFEGCWKPAVNFFGSAEANGEVTNEKFCDEHSAGIVLVPAFDPWADDYREA